MIQQMEGKTVEAVTDFIFLGSKSLQTVTAAMKLKMLPPWKLSYGKPRQSIKKRRHHFTNKGLRSQRYQFFPAVMYRCES